MVKDYEHVTRAHDKVSEGYDYLVTHYQNEKIIDAIISSIKELMQCDNPEMRNSCLDYIMTESHQFMQDYSREDGPRIYREKRDEYLFILNKVEHMYVAELRKYIEDAKEVPLHSSKTEENNAEQEK